MSASPAPSSPVQSPVEVRPLAEEDLAEARRIFHLAFSTFLGLPDPSQFLPDRDFVSTRWRTEPAGAFAAESDGELLGSNFATRWGSVGSFGPLTIRPDAWDQGVARRLLEATVDRLDEWGVRHAGLFTFPGSAKHLHLYQKFGFWPRHLVAVTSRPVRRGVDAAFEGFAGLPEETRESFLDDSLALAGGIYEGLDLRHEIRSVARQGLGDTLVVRDEGGLAAFAICHAGPGTEAGAGTCAIKFAAARGAPELGRLLDACEAFADSRGLQRIEAGVSTARLGAYRLLIGRGFRTELTGVAMHRAGDEGYHRDGAFVLDDWR